MITQLNSYEVLPIPLPQQIFLISMASLSQSLVNEECITSSAFWSPVVYKLVYLSVTLWKQITGPHPQSFWFPESRVRTSNVHSDKFPGEAHAAGYRARAPV